MGQEQQISRESVERAMGEFRHLGRTEFLKKYGFGKAREYFIHVTASDEWFDSKAIAGAAYGFQFPDQGPLRPDSFSGGEATVAARLTELGFNVIATGEDCSAQEIRLLLDDYFSMLELESEGAAYNKAARNRALRGTLTPRTQGSIERKHQNVSSALHEMGLPFISGYKPSSNAQRLLGQEVKGYLEAHRDRLDRIFDALARVPIDAPLGLGDEVLVSAPLSASVAQVARPRVPRKLDYAERDARNRSLGRSGEQWVVSYERNRLTRAGRSDLAAAVEWVSDTQGDGAGYDVRSKQDEGGDLFIEVKTTNGGELTAFVLTECELACAREFGPRFRLYRVFNFARSPRLFIVPGPLEVLSLEPSEYRVRFPAASQ
jgi:hypothetical protein